jgi:acetyl-CoA carboxylase carboxyl transferase subunit alpha
LHLTADKLLELKLIDKIVSEPLGGAHRDPQGMADTLKKVLLGHLQELRMQSLEQLLSNRYQRLMSFGR